MSSQTKAGSSSSVGDVWRPRFREQSVMGRDKSKKGNSSKPEGQTGGGKTNMESKGQDNGDAIWWWNPVDEVKVRRDRAKAIQGQSSGSNVRNTNPCHGGQGHGGGNNSNFPVRNNKHEVADEGQKPTRNQNYQNFRGRGSGRGNRQKVDSDLELQFNRGPQVSTNFQSRDRRGRGCGFSIARSNPRPIFGFKRLHSCLSEPADKILMTIYNDKEAWKQFIGSKEVIAGASDDLLCLVVHVLGKKLCSDESMLPIFRDETLLITTGVPEFIAKITAKCNGFIFQMSDQPRRGPIGNNDSMIVIDTSPKEFLTSVCRFGALATERLEATAKDYLKQMIASAFSSALALKASNPSLEYVAAQLQELVSGINSQIKKDEDKRLTEVAFARRNNGFSDLELTALDNAELPNDFREISVIPTIEELQSTDVPFLRPNKKNGAYIDANHYLDVQFRLLREDFVQPLRNGIQNYKAKRELDTVKIYPGVKFVGSELVRESMHFWIELPEKTFRRIKWDRSKRLLNGNLVAFTKDAFRTVYFGVVGIRDEKKLSGEGRLSIIPEGVPPIYDIGDVFLMFESQVFFQAYRHVLSTLQTLELATFPMAKYIVDAISDVQHPTYLRDADHGNEDAAGRKMLVIPLSQTTLNETDEKTLPSVGVDAEDDLIELDLEGAKTKPILTIPEVEAKIFPFGDNTWPSADKLSLDCNQYEAFKAALTREFSIIQGPPGTGKTYLGLRIAEVLIKNKNLWRQDPITQQTYGPLVVVCYTNHALDQFLEGILDIFQGMEKVHPKIVRVGGRSQSERLKSFQLQNLTGYRGYQTRMDSTFMNRFRDTKNSVGSLDEKLLEIESKLRELQNIQGIVDFEQLSVWTKLCLEYPSTIWDCFKKSNFFGLDEATLGTNNFNSVTIVDHWFWPKPNNSNPNSRLPRQISSQLAQNVATQNQSENVTNSQEEETQDDEDYDMNELMEGRIVDDSGPDILTRLSAYTASGGDRVLPYLNNLSVYQCRKNLLHWEKEHTTVTMLQQMSEEQLRVLQPPPTKHEDIGTIRSNIQFMRNTADLLHELLHRYNRQLLPLPDVADALEGLHVHNQYDPTRRGGPLQSLQSRWASYFHVVERTKVLLIERRKKVEADLVKEQRKLSELKRYADCQILRQNTVVGMTTTGAGKYYDLLKNLNSKIVIVEEAAEVLEAHIVTCLTKDCEQLILIGMHTPIYNVRHDMFTSILSRLLRDHLQLKPSTTVYQLARQYNLNISLFERMINNNLNCYPLKVQHRMRPQISDLVRGSIYEILEDSPSVLYYDNVLGLTKNLFFITHKHLEKGDSDSLSKSNEFEADFLAGFCRYLILQGYEPHQITVLSTYTGQMLLLKKKIRAIKTCDGIRITCVDNFQGEENDIILLSLVRSNEECKVGFLSVENRVCVALSRAKMGLYIIGNMSMLAEGRNKIWPKIKAKLGQENLGKSLEIKCQIHDTISEVENDREFYFKAPEGGCTLPCDKKLRCGHICVKMCHVPDSDHIKYQCREQCTRKCPEAEEHPCRDYCFKCFNKKCEPCRTKITILLECDHEKKVDCAKRREDITCYIKVTKDLACGHQMKVACHRKHEEMECFVLLYDQELPCGHKVKSVECHQNLDEIKCEELVEKPLPCGHSTTAWCHFDVTDFKCQVEEKKQLPCGHDKQVKCFQNFADIICRAWVPKLLPCRHEQNVQCKDDPKEAICLNRCDTRLKCGHSCPKKCHVANDPEHLDFKCMKKCSRSCSAGHICVSKKKHCCSDKCPPCTTKIQKKLLKCDHEAIVECGKNLLLYQCQESCQKIRDCGHKCENICSNECGVCKVKTTKTVRPCNHPITTDCSEQPTTAKCVVLVSARGSSKCSHHPLVPCNVSANASPDTIQSYCTEPCGYRFPEEEGGCGHGCKGTCGTCLGGRLHKKCEEKCGRALVCGHICHFPCSQACPPCGQKCLMVCDHSQCKKNCGNPCVNCAEKCSWHCRHKKCTKLCGEMCNRDACDEPCNLTLKCGHPCIGFCGEPCPPLCRFCDQEKLLEFQILYTEDEDDSRFIFLPDCGHTIEAEGLKGHMTASHNGEIGVKRCPRCQTIILRCRRFGNIIRQNFNNVLDVKNKVFGNVREIKNGQIDLIKQICAESWESGLSKIRQMLLQELVIKPLLKNPTSVGFNPKVHKIKPIDGFKLHSLQAVGELGSYTIKILLEGKKNNIMSPFYDILSEKSEALFVKILSRKLPLSPIELRDLEREVDRIHDLQQLYSRRCAIFSTDKRYGEFSKKYEHVLEIILSNSPYIKQLKAIVGTHLKLLEEMLATGIRISDIERQEIVRAMGMKKGHWFKCPNGHVYVIGDCGGANQVSKCNECGAQIGGGNHALLPNNDLATEMDGGTAPAWPTALQR